jgi:poly(3-hydroxybutyrate) depolymerase
MLLYQMHELGRAWMAPMTYWADANAKIFGASGTWLGKLPGAGQLAAGIELMYLIC